MSWQAIVQALVLVVLLAATVPLLGRYMADVYGAREDGSAPGDRFFGPIERFIYRCAGVDAQARAALERLRALAGRVQPRVGAGPVRTAAAAGSTALQPDGSAGRQPMGSFNAAISFVTNTNWQWFSGEVSDQPPHQDDRQHGAELRVCGRRHGRGDRSDPGDHPHRVPTPRQLLGRPRADHDAHPAAAGLVFAVVLISQGVIQNLGDGWSP